MSSSVKNFLAVIFACLAMATMSVSAVQAGNMAIEMSAMAEDTSMSADEMTSSGDDCGACPGDQDSKYPMACPPLCVAPAVAILPPAAIFTNASVAVAEPHKNSARLGRDTLPDPYPPRISSSC